MSTIWGKTATAYTTIETYRRGLITRERLAPSGMESELFCAHLVERLHWAVEDAYRTPSRKGLNRAHG